MFTPITDLLISAAMLQDVLIDNVTGLPMENGTITMYHDNARTILKDWYYQTGVPGNYTYITLPNPLTLSGIGTIQDANGNDVIPFYYPWTQDAVPKPDAYYIKVVDSNGASQFTRQNFPFNPTSSALTTINSTLRNLLANSQFWRNSISQDLTSSTQVIIAADQHDGFSMPDMQFMKNATGATDTLTFMTFGAGQFLNQPSVQPQNQDVTPEYYCNLACTATGSETTKYIQIPVCLHIKNLDTTNCTFTLWSRGNSGVTTLTIYILQFLGTGVTSPPPFTITTLSLSPGWVKYSVNFTFPTDLTSPALILGAGGDDAFYLQIGYPTGNLFNIDIAKPCLYIGNTIPSNEFQTYDQIDRVISSPRTGDVKTTFSALTSIPNASYVPYGWLPMNDGSIGNPNSNASTFAATQSWQLYSLIWNGISDNYCPVLNSSGVPVGRGSSAYADFTANNQLFLPKALGRLFAGTDTSGANFAKFFTVSSSILYVNDTTPYYIGTPVNFGTLAGGVLPSPLMTATLYYLIVTGSTTVQVASTLDNAINDIPITLTGGSGSIFFTATLGANPFGSYTGQYAHNQTTAELNEHAHTLPGDTGLPNNAHNADTTDVGTIVATTTTGNTGGNQAFNVTQPTTFANYIIKL